MKYVCLIYDEEKVFDEMPKQQIDSILGEYFALTDSLTQGGQMVAAEALQSVSTATVVRVRNGRLSTTDGPYAETKEQLGGFYLIDAKDLDEAIRIAGRIPSARWGSIEVRPIMDYRNRET
ncbi:YciI family protein [Lysobacter sp. LF1]|uniref:YciI family protein n=1 Tax=Lysobacter stagni TaxID=3045172 RepID=A0ABT6XB80_9GAMM|nr:YciI family protein [Lysobacter sp. LF1]MDI9237346.1 YciI family protein [Lysobacter sp. LF1]